MNIKVKILEKKFASDQYKVEYINSKGLLKHTWVHKAELFMGNTTDLEKYSMNASEHECSTVKFTIQDYIKLLTNFEQHIAESWCNSRKMKHKLLAEVQEDDKDVFTVLDTRQSKYGISNSLQYHGELLFEVLDTLFGQFCLNSFSVPYDHDASNNDFILGYLAYKKFTEHLGYLQHWFGGRRNDDTRIGRNYYKISELLNPSIEHHCEQCIFTEDCTHECCMKLLSFTYYQKYVHNGESTCKSILSRKRSRDELPAKILECEDYDGLLSERKELLIVKNQLSTEDSEPILEQELVITTNTSQSKIEMLSKRSSR